MDRRGRTDRPGRERCGPRLRSAGRGRRGNRRHDLRGNTGAGPHARHRRAGRHPDAGRRSATRSGASSRPGAQRNRWPRSTAAWARAGRKKTWHRAAATPGGRRRWPASTWSSTACGPERSRVHGLQPDADGRAPPPRRARVAISLGRRGALRQPTRHRQARPGRERRGRRGTAARRRPSRRASSRCRPSTRPRATCWQRRICAP